MIAREFVQSGARVYICSRKAAPCNALAKELSALGVCVSLPFDIAESQGIAALVDAFNKHERALDVLINNAGATWGADLDEFPESGWDKTVALNMKTVFFLTQKLLPSLRAAASRQNPARVINVASIDGLRPPSMDSYAYSASKAGCLMLTRHLARRLARESILVNAIAPGPFRTKMTEAFLNDDGGGWIEINPLGRAGTAEDIAGVAVFLASRASAYTTGAVIPCDGGWAEVL